MFLINGGGGGGGQPAIAGTATLRHELWARHDNTPMLLKQRSYKKIAFKLHCRSTYLRN